MVYLRSSCGNGPTFEGTPLSCSRRREIYPGSRFPHLPLDPETKVITLCDPDSTAKRIRNPRVRSRRVEHESLVVQTRGEGEVLGFQLCIPCFSRRVGFFWPRKKGSPRPKDLTGTEVKCHSGPARRFMCPFRGTRETPSNYLEVNF